MACEPPDPPITPYLMVGNGHRAVDWYIRAFAGRQCNRFDAEDGRLAHAMVELANGGAIYIADEFPEMIDTVGTLAPDSLGGTTVTVALAVDDVDAWLERARAEGACTIREPVDEFYGRHARLRDPFGHVWSLTGPRRDAG
ncbi:VOC family protein [Brevundimonas sp.]|uniref:VOC family protein n=1 Tax=Brevundimonas sp. TaxID=1871086 RepID=UPI002D7466A2|nr:VOC family protein [Brevundimonas sp.]HYD27736.1 VOC family protein [Brevundimonas sp.]